MGIRILGRRVDIKSNANTIFGMFIVAFGTGLFCAVGAIAQYNGGSILQLLFGSYAVQFMIGWAWWCIRKPSQSVRWYGDAPHTCNVWIRGLLYWAVQFTWWKGLEMVKIGDAEAILFISPMVTIFFARLLLKEELPRTYPIILTITIIALIFICQPQFIFNFAAKSSYDPISLPGMIFLLICIACWSTNSLLIRYAKEAHWLQVNLVSAFQSAWMWTPLLAILNHFVGNNLGDGNGTPASNADPSNIAWIDGVDFTAWDWSAGTILAMVSMGFFGFFAVTCKVVGYQLGEATKVASMEYLDIVFAYFFQYFLFHKSPNTWEMIGAGLLIVSCMIQIVEEKYFPSHSDTDKTTNNYSANIDENENENENENDSLINETQALLSQIKEKTSKRFDNFNSFGYSDNDEYFQSKRMRSKRFGGYGGQKLNGIPLSRLDLKESSHYHINFDGSTNVEVTEMTSPKITIY